MKWKKIDNFYSVSDTGLVKANERIIETKTGKRKYQEGILKPDINPNDKHLRVTLSYAGKTKRFMVHRLVAEAFIPNNNNYSVINHKDENPLNNCVDNLEWCSVSYNNAYNNRHERIGDAEGYSINVFDSKGLLLETFPSIAKFAKKYNISNTTAWRRLNDGKMVQNVYIKRRLNEKACG